MPHHCLGLPYCHYQLVLTWYLHQPESHQLSLHKVLYLVTDIWTQRSDPRRRLRGIASHILYSVKSIIQYVGMTMSSTLVHGTRLRNCWLTRGDLENVSPPSQGQFSPEPGGGGDVHLLSSYYEHPVFNIYPKLVHTLKTWSNAIILQNWQNTFSCRDQIEVKFSP